MIHVLPLNDVKDHELCTTCECLPAIHEEEGEMVVVHNSFDGREYIELLTDLSSINNN